MERLLHSSLALATLGASTHETTEVDAENTTTRKHRGDALKDKTGIRHIESRIRRRGRSANVMEKNCRSSNWERATVAKTPRIVVEGQGQPRGSVKMRKWTVILNATQMLRYTLPWILTLFLLKRWWADAL